MSFENETSATDRASWVAPQVRRLAVSEAELSTGPLVDGGVEQFS